MSTEDQPPDEIVDATIVPDQAPAPAAPAPSTEIVHRPQGTTDLIPAANAGERVQIATEIATALDDVIRRQGMRTKMGRAKVVKADGTEAWEDRYHVNVEGWQTLATFLGLAVVPIYARKMIDPATGTPQIVSYPVKVDRYYPKKDGGGLKQSETYDVNGYSYEARVEVYKDGALLAAAESVCTREEDAWKTRDDYALLGMAQTRATSRAIAQAARWVVGLAGYAGTPAEEMPQQQTEPEPEQGPPFGPECSPDLAEKMVRAIAYALEQDQASREVGQLVQDLRAEGGGYLPRITARSISLFAKAIKTKRDQPPAQAPGPEPEPTPADTEGVTDLSPDGPAPGTVTAPSRTGQVVLDIQALRDAGCICTSPLEAGADNAPMGAAADTCPILGHGLPF